jgi:hypothetical protein
VQEQERWTSPAEAYEYLGVTGLEAMFLKVVEHCHYTSNSGWMVDSVIDLDVLDFERIDTFQATNIETVFRWIGTALIACVDSAHRAEKVLSHVLIKLIFKQKLATGHNSQTGKRDRSYHCPFPLTDRAITMPRILDSIDFFNHWHLTPAT